MFWNSLYNENDNNKNDDYDRRSHQDNFGFYNNDSQYCSHCGRYVKFEYDRCIICKGN